MKTRVLLLSIVYLFSTGSIQAAKILIPMDSLGQSNHLKAYGVAFAALVDSIKVDWLLNYRGGSYGMAYDDRIEALCAERGVSYTVLSNREYSKITKQINSPAFNGSIVKLEKAPRIAVYTPPNFEPWDDAVTLALTYAEVPFEKIYVEEVLTTNLDKYDWIHVHHEDFTGQYGKFYLAYKDSAWYKKDKRDAELLAEKNGFKKVSQMQLAVVKKLRDFVVKGGNLFAMCSAAETFDIALAAEGTDICTEQFDGDPIDDSANVKLDYTKCLAFSGFAVSMNAYEYRHSDIGNPLEGQLYQGVDYFYLYPYPAKSNKVGAMLCQNHTNKVAGFRGQNTGFRKEFIKSDVLVMGITAKNMYYPYKESVRLNTDDMLKVGEPAVSIDNTPNDMQRYRLVYMNQAKYIHCDYGKGTWTFLGGHDPEDYQHLIGSQPTELSKYPHSPGYRLILNNILSPGVSREPVPTIILSHDSIAGKSPAETSEAVKNEMVAANTKILIYPSPTTGKATIEFPQSSTNTRATPTKIQQVVIMDIAGKIFFNRQFNEEKVQIDMSNYPAGTYLVQVNGIYAGNIMRD